jgi:aryl-alcohol dehydrogenase-like predicted oxidoreductase
MPVPTRSIGHQGLAVPALGVGCWGMSDAYGHADRAASIATIREALELGVNFFDTADVYGAGHNETLLGEALGPDRASAIIATKFGFRGNEHGQPEVCGSPAYVREACDASLKRLQTDYIDLYYLHRVDKRVPIEETVEAMAALLREGKVRHLGLSEASAETLRRASAVHPIAALQSEYSLVTREVEAEILPACRELGIGFVAFSPLGRGLLGGKLKNTQAFEDGDYRRNLPRFADANLDQNLALVRKLEDIAQTRRTTPSQIALAWLLQQGRDIVPIPGMKTIAHLRENVAALQLDLTDDELVVLRTFAESVRGPRHNPANARFFDEGTP